MNVSILELEAEVDGTGNQSLTGKLSSYFHVWIDIPRETKKGTMDATALHGLWRLYFSLHGILYCNNSNRRANVIRMFICCDNGKFNLFKLKTWIPVL